MNFFGDLVKTIMMMMMMMIMMMMMMMNCFSGMVDQRKAFPARTIVRESLTCRKQDLNIGKTRVQA